jgi:hypothetical protein
MTVDRHLKYRMDHRTREEFQTDISQFTEMEFYWGIVLRFELTRRGHPCSIEEHGVDNTGRLIEGRLPNHNADKLYHFLDGSESMKVEIKTIPEKCNRYHTIKVSAIKGCWDQGARILVPKSGVYWMYGRGAFEWIMDRCDERKDIKAFGYSPCYRLSMSLVRKMISDGLIIEREWTQPARKFISEMSHILLAERKTNRFARV